MQVEIWSDVVCPWCYIGKRRFEAALAQFEHRDQVELTWRSFELDPGAPRLLPGTLGEILARKKGMPVAQAEAMQAQLTTLAAADGLEYHFERTKSGNSFDAHRLLHLAAATPAAAGTRLQDAMKERLLRAYFTEGLPIGDPETLVSLAAEAGIDPGVARAALAGDDYAEAVRGDERRAATLGIQGVPFVVIDGRYGVSGAQTPEVFLRALETAWAESQPSETAAASDASGSCASDTCAVPA